VSRKSNKNTDQEQQAKTEAVVDELIEKVTQEPAPEEGGTPAATADLSAELEASRAEAAKNRDLYLRSRADLENYRRRAQREKEDMARFGNENLLKELLPVRDNLERAVEHAREGEPSDGGLLEGVKMTLGQLQKVFERFGVKPIEAVDQPFDPAHHEAMGHLESEGLPPNHVARELQKGYLLNDRLLRPALVMVSKVPAGEGGKKD